MKKLVFTALAVVAFSGVAMANTEEVKKEVIEIKENKEILEATPCEDRMIDLYEYAIGDGPENIALLNKYLNICYKK